MCPLLGNLPDVWPPPVRVKRTGQLAGGWSAAAGGLERPRPNPSLTMIGHPRPGLIGETGMNVEAAGASPVRTAIANASRATGMDFGFLLATAVRESSLDPTARAPTSTATGLFQFLEQTWLATVKRHGARHGMAAEAAQIEQGSDGMFRVADPEARRRILDMRYDPQLSALMAGELANDNADIIRVRAGVEPQYGDLYAAHFLGAAGASELIVTARERPWTVAADLFPAAARANRPVFYEPDGRPRTVVEVLDNLRATARRDVPAISAREFAGAPGADGPYQRWPDFSGRSGGGSSVAAQVYGASLAPSINDRATLQLLSGGAGGADGNPLAALADPATLAQVYGADEAAQGAAEAAAIQVVASTGSIARALSPASDRGGSSSSAADDSSPDPLAGLRGRN